MQENKQHFQYIMLYDFKKGKNATEMQKKICAVYGDSAVTDQMCQSGLPSFMLEICRWKMLHGQADQWDSDQIETLIENNQCHTMWEIADMLKISTSI